MTKVLKKFTRFGRKWEKGEQVPEGTFEQDTFNELECSGLIGEPKAKLVVEAPAEDEEKED